MNATATTKTGTYYPNAKGARTLADVRPLMIDGERVSAVVDSDSTWTVFIGGTAVATGDLYGTEGNLNDYFAEQAAQAAADSKAATDDEPLSLAVQQVRAKGNELAEFALNLSNSSAQPHRYVSPNGKVSWIKVGDPRHPLRRAQAHTREALVLTNWTQVDEDGYLAYVSQGIGDTDGYFAPLDRFAWATTAR